MLSSNVLPPPLLAEDRAGLLLLVDDVVVEVQVGGVGVELQAVADVVPQPVVGHLARGVDRVEGVVGPGPAGVPAHAVDLVPRDQDVLDMRTRPAQDPAFPVVSVGQLPVDENEVISVDLHPLAGPTGEAGVAAPAWVGGVPPAVVEGDAVPLLAGAVGLDPTPDPGLVAVQRVHLHPGGVLRSDGARSPRHPGRRPRPGTRRRSRTARGRRQSGASRRREGAGSA